MLNLSHIHKMWYLVVICPSAHVLPDLHLRGMFGRPFCEIRVLLKFIGTKTFSQDYSTSLFQCIHMVTLHLF